MPFKLRHITIAAQNYDEMLEFYDQVFNSELERIAANGNIAVGILAGIGLTICNNILPQIEAEKSLFQFHLQVDDVENVIDRALEYGGALYQEPQINDDTIQATITDPDGNTIVIYHEE